MRQIIQFVSPVQLSEAHAPGPAAPAIHTDAVHVVFTTLDETLAAVGVAATLGKAMRVPLTLIHFRSVPYALSIDAQAGVSPLETEMFVERLRAEGIDLRVRVYLCHNVRRAISMAFKPHSVVLVGGRHRPWPTASERLRRHLEDAGHFVVFVDALMHSACGHRSEPQHRVATEMAPASSDE